MATVRNFTSTFAGDAIRGYILKALVGGETWSTDGVSIEERIKYKRVINRLDTTGTTVTAADCDFTPAGGIVIDERILEPKNIQINAQTCVYDYENLWGEDDEQSIADTNQAIVDKYIKDVQKAVEIATWQGNSTGSTGTISDLVDGFEYIQANDGAVAVSAVTLTKSNIIEQLDRVVDAIPDAVYKEGVENLVIFLSHKAHKYYEQAMAAQGVNRNNSGDVSNIYGIELRPVGGLSSNNVMSAGAKKNYFFGTKLMSDMNDVRILDMRELDGSDNLRFKLKASFDVNIAYPSETVLYS